MEDDDDAAVVRVLEVPPVATGMRLDRFLAARFRDRSRSELARAVRSGQVRDALDRPLRTSAVVRGGDLLRLTIPEIAPSGPPPDFPPVIYEDARVVAIDKPPGLMAHPSGTRFVYALVGLAKARWPDHRVDLVHRLDKDTTGINLITKDLEANRFLKARMKDGGCRKEYVALVRGTPTWDRVTVDAPIGAANGPIRIQMAVTDDGLSARTDVEVEERHPTKALTRVRCRIHTGRTHQIRVHLAHLGFPILGDLMYGVPPEVFLAVQDHGLTDEIVAITGASRHALHAARLTFPHPDGGERTLECALPPDMVGWWNAPPP